MANTAENCPRFQICSAPLCPLLENGVWYSEEEVCKRRGLGQNPVVRNQKKIVKKIREKAKDTYFTYGMLKKNITIKKGVKGIKPDTGKESQIEVWIKKRKEREKKQLSEEQKEVLRKSFKERLKIATEKSRIGHLLIEMILIGSIKGILLRNLMCL